MLIKTLKPLLIEIGAASIEIPAYSVEAAPAAVARTLIAAGHATPDLEAAPTWSDLPPAPVTLTDLDAVDASTDVDVVHVAAVQRVVVSTYAIGKPQTLENQRDIFRVDARCAWVPATVAEAIIAAGAGHRSPWFAKTTADAGLTYDDDAAATYLSAEDTPNDPTRPWLGNDKDATVHPWSARE